MSYVFLLTKIHKILRRTYALERIGLAIPRPDKAGRHGTVRTIFPRQRCQLAIQQKRPILALFESGEVEAECE